VKLSTEVPFPKNLRQLNHQDSITLLGSCFSANIGAWLESMQFNACPIPSGIIYNPISIAKHIRHALSGKWDAAIPLENANGLFVHTDFHSSFAHPSHAKSQKAIARGAHQLGERLRQADVLFLTFGSAIVYRKKVDGSVVNNCHKLPSTHFEKSQCSMDELSAEMRLALQELRQHNPKVFIYLTVSPVRHLRHGAIENQRSKSRLLLLCESLSQEFDNCAYLPVYEFVMDELRGYRFYDHTDLVHLNAPGLEMLKAKLETSLFDSNTQLLLQEVKTFIRMVQHRPLHPESNATAEYMHRLGVERAKLQALLPRAIKY
jgi:hypothetical protein